MWITTSLANNMIMWMSQAKALRVCGGTVQRVKSEPTTGRRARICRGLVAGVAVDAGVSMTLNRGRGGRHRLALVDLPWC